MKKPIIFALMLMTLTLSYAQTDTRLIHGAGTITCGTFIAENEANRQPEISWALGFLDGANIFAGHTVDILKGIDVASIRAALVNYCQKKPLDMVAEGVTNIYSQLVSKSMSR